MKFLSLLPPSVTVVTCRRLLCRATLAAFLLSLFGCVTVKPQVDSSPAPETEQTPDTLSADSDTSSGIALDSELVFDFLLADIAERRGYPATSLEAAVRLAERTRDRTLVLRAFRSAMREGRGDLAGKMAELLGETGATEISVAFARAQAYLLSENPGSAVDVLEALLKSRPDERERLFNSAGELFAQQRDPAAFVQYMRALADAYPEERHAFFALSYVASRAQDNDTLTYAINRALELSPDWEEAAIVRYVQLVQMNDFEGARQFAERFLERNPNALDLADRHARLLAARGDMESARGHFQRILRQSPQDPDILLAAALVDMQLEKWSSARRLLLRLLELNPADDEIRMHLGLVAASRERYDDAIAWYKEVGDEAFLFRAQLRIVSALRERDGPEAALDHLKGLIPVTLEEEVELLLTQEQILRQMNRLQDAHALLDGAVREIPDNSDLLYARGLVAAELRILPQHEADIRRVIELDPDNAHAYNALGYTLADQTDRYQEALNLITRALELAPNDPFILDSMGWVQYRLGNFDAAQEYLRKALALRDDAEIAAHLGEVLWKIGVKEEARALWDKALRLNPENPTLLETLERLNPR